MSLHDYQCVRCGEEFESLKAQEVIPCRVCSSMAERVKRVHKPGYFRSGKYGKAGGIEE